jgi:hypothetical protein
LWDWKAWVVLAVFAIPVFAFGALVLLPTGPLLGVMFLGVVPVGVFDVLKGRPEVSQPVQEDGASHDEGGA